MALLKMFFLRSLLFSILLTSTLANASGQNRVKVKHMVFHKDGVVFVYVTNPTSGINGNIPTCGTLTSNTNRYATSDRNTISALLMAQTTKSEINVNGANNCSVWPDTESVHSITVF